MGRQNQNESFNATIWERLPKTKYNSFTHLELATYDAAACFNIGRKATILMYEKLEMKPGSYVVHGCAKLNRKRLSRSEYRNKIIVKKRRTVLRGKAKKEKIPNWTKKGLCMAQVFSRLTLVTSLLTMLFETIFLKKKNLTAFF